VGWDSLAWVCCWAMPYGASSGGDEMSNYLEKHLDEFLDASELYKPSLGELIRGVAWCIYDLDDEWVNEEFCELSERVITKEWRKLFTKTVTLEQALWGADYGVDFKNDVFEMNMYYWGSCTCGYEELAEEWDKNNSHEKSCYQSLVEAKLREHGWTEDKYGYFSAPKDLEYKKRRAIEDNIRKKYCKQFGLSFPDASAVHCTCSYDDKWEKFTSENKHDHECPIIRPNFRHYGSGVEIRWYKYIGRGMNVNVARISRDYWRQIFQECRNSLK